MNMCCSGARFTIENFLLFVVMVNKVKISVSGQGCLSVLVKGDG
jgi:hypothetical protein